MKEVHLCAMSILMAADFLAYLKNASVVLCLFLKEVYLNIVNINIPRNVHVIVIVIVAEFGMLHW
jgi:hypothetical protein